MSVFKAHKILKKKLLAIFLLTVLMIMLAVAPTAFTIIQAYYSEVTIPRYLYSMGLLLSLILISIYTVFTKNNLKIIKSLAILVLLYNCFLMINYTFNFSIKRYEEHQANILRSHLLINDLNSLSVNSVLIIPIGWIQFAMMAHQLENMKIIGKSPFKLNYNFTAQPPETATLYKQTPLYNIYLDGENNDIAIVQWR
jgi:hypothetical protein